MALHFVWYNFCRIHASLRVSPAMAAGIIDELLSLADMVRLSDQYEKTQPTQAQPGYTRLGELAM